MKSFFKRFKKKIPGISSNSSGYFVRENLLEDIRDLKSVLKTGFEPPFSETDKEITFHGVPLKGTSPRVIKSKFGSPMHILDNSKNIDGHKVFFYKDSINIYKFLIQYHFIDNEFFFASNKVSSVTVLTDEVKTKVIDRIKIKYFAENAKEIVGLKVKLKDPNGSILYTIDEVYYRLNYLLNNKTTKQLIKKYSDYEASQVRPAGFKESLEEYI